MAEGQVYDIPEAGFAWFKEKLTKLSKRSEKLVGERLFLTVVGFHYEGEEINKRKIMEVFVAFPEPKLAGWEFVARIDHASEAGNVVRTTGKRQLPEKYRTSDPICDHCGHKRRRRDTFVVHHTDDGVFKQVGSSCLKDFLGHGDADKWAKMAELVASIGEFARSSGSQGSTGLRDYSLVDTEFYMQAAAYAVTHWGWTSKAKAKTSGESTASRTWSAMHDINRRLVSVTEEMKDLAEKAMEWGRSLADKPNLNDYEHNASVVANLEALEGRHLGIAASIVGVYYTNQRKLAGAGQPVRQNSGFVGNEGEKIELEVKIDEVRDLDNSLMHKMHDRSGNRFTWFATRAALRDKLDNVVRIQATVKKHSEFRGVKQTILTRVKVV
jgi:hypothetical protein